MSYKHPREGDLVKVNVAYRGQDPVWVEGKVVNIQRKNVMPTRVTVKRTDTGGAIEAPINDVVLLAPARL